MNEGEFLHKWGGTNLFNVFNCDECHMVHPDDWQILNNYKYIKSLHLCIAVTEKYLLIDLVNQPIRVDYKVFSPIQARPTFLIDQNVKFYNSKGTLQFGKVIGIHLHNNLGKIYYDVEVNGKKKSHRYFDEDLQKIEE